MSCEKDDNKNINFADTNFKNLLVSDFDLNEDLEISFDEALHIKELNYGDCDFTSLQGIEYFTNLTYLNCNASYLTELDVSKNKQLTYLNCMGNELTALDVSKNTVLDSLYCWANQNLTSLTLKAGQSISLLEKDDHTTIKYVN